MLVRSLVLGLVLLACGCAEKPVKWSEQSAQTRLLVDEGKLNEATYSAQQALALARSQLPYNDPGRLRAMHELALVSALNGYEAQAEALWLEAIQIAQRTPGFPDYDLCLYASNLARLYHLQGKTERAEPLYVLGYAVWERTAGLTTAEHQELAIHLSNYANLLDEMGRPDEAVPIRKAIEQVRLGL